MIIPIIFIIVIILFIIIKIFNIELYTKYNNCTNMNTIYAFRSLLTYWSQFAKEYNMKYSIAYGSLLGYEREKQIIGYDEDMDTLINQETVNKLIELAGDQNEKRVIFTIHT